MAKNKTILIKEYLGGEGYDFTLIAFPTLLSGKFMRLNDQLDNLEK